MTNLPPLDHVAKRLYAKLLADEGLRAFFDGVDIERQASGMARVLARCFEPDVEFDREALRSVHRGPVARGMNDRHFDDTVRHLEASLLETGFTADDVARVKRLLGPLRVDVLDRS